MYCCTNTNTPADSYTGGDASRDTVTSLDASCDTDASPARYADANADASSTARDADTVTSPSTRVADADADLAEGAIDVVGRPLIRPLLVDGLDNWRGGDGVSQTSKGAGKLTADYSDQTDGNQSGDDILSIVGFIRTTMVRIHRRLQRFFGLDPRSQTLFGNDVVLA